MNDHHSVVPPDKNIRLNDYDPEVVRNGALALLPGRRFVILDFEMPSSIELADS